MRSKVLVYGGEIKWQAISNHHQHSELPESHLHILVGQRSPKKGDTDGQVLCHYRGGARDYIIKKHKKIYPKCK